MPLGSAAPYETSFMPHDEPITAWIASLKESDEEAARQLWEAFFEKLVRVARRKLGGRRRATDEEDVALSVFDTLCRGAGEGRFEQLEDRTDLWRLMMRIVGQKAVDHVRHENRLKRGGGEVRGHSVLGRPGEPDGNFDQLAGDELPPDFLALIEEEHQRLMASLPDQTLQDIALLRMQGYANNEISDQVGISLRSVERKLGLIRRQWSQLETPSR